MPKPGLRQSERYSGRLCRERSFWSWRLDACAIRRYFQRNRGETSWDLLPVSGSGLGSVRCVNAVFHLWHRIVLSSVIKRE